MHNYNLYLTRFMRANAFTIKRINNCQPRRHTSSSHDSIKVFRSHQNTASNKTTTLNPDPSSNLNPNLRRASSAGVRASFYRGGTSKGLMIHGPDLGEKWTSLSYAQKHDLKLCERILRPFFMAAMGSPDDEYARQLNGMGGGVSSLSKAVIVERAAFSAAAAAAANDGNGGGGGGDGTACSNADKREGGRVDINYWFVQIGIRDGELDMAGNCGNLSSAVAPFALDLGLLSDEEIRMMLIQDSDATRDEESQNGDVRAQIFLRNINTGKRIRAEVQVEHNHPGICFQPVGNYKLDGVSGTASPVVLSFLEPGGAKTGKPLPTGNVVDTLTIGGKTIQATLSDISNPGVFVDGRQIGWDPSRKPEELTANTKLMDDLEEIRRAGTSMMGLDPNVPSVPKIVLVYPPDSNDIDIRCQALSMQQAHKAVPGTLALNLGVASKIRGTIPFQLARQRDPQNIVIGHPSGKIEVGAEIKNETIKGAKLVRTARWLMDGTVNDTPS